MTSKQPSPLRVAIACGGTGGHLFPGVAVGRQLVERGCAVTLLISPKEVDQEAVNASTGMEVRTLPAVGLQKGQKLAFAIGFMGSLHRAAALFRLQRPHAALAMGGFTSAPPILVARAYRAFTCLHESNTIPGRANRWLSRLVNQAFVGFPSTAHLLRHAPVKVTGTPARPEFSLRNQAVCRTELGLDPARPVLLVMGGSQGATGINRLIVNSIALLLDREPRWQFIHLTGTTDLEQVRTAYQASGATAVVRSFCAHMDCAMGAATIGVSRAGASSLAEIAAMRLPTVLIPYPAAMDNHQFHNAQAFAQTGAARLLEQASANPRQLVDLVTELLRTDVAQSVRSALTRWHNPEAAREIADHIVAGALSRRDQFELKRRKRMDNPFALPLAAPTSAGSAVTQPGKLA